MLRRTVNLCVMTLVVLLTLGLTLACSGASAPAPTTAPAAAPTKAAAPATAPAAAPTKAPAATTAPAAAPTKAAAPQATGYFKDKTIEIILPNSAGGGNDTITRYSANYVKQYAQAKDVLVKNVVGAAGLKGFNEQFVAKGDGFTLGAGSLASMLLQQLSEQEGVQFDANKFQYLGRIYTEQRMLLVPWDSKIKSLDDVVNLGRPVVMPIQGPDDDFLMMALVNKMLGLETKTITGYAGQADVFLACMRGEGDWAMTGVRTAQGMIKNKEMRPIMAIGSERHSDFPDIPTATELVKGEENKKTMEAVNNIVELFMNYWMPPSAKPDVVAEMRGIMAKALTDKTAVEEAPKKAGGRQLMYMPGEDVQKRVAQVISEGKALTPILKEALASIK